MEENCIVEGTAFRSRRSGALSSAELKVDGMRDSQDPQRVLTSHTLTCCRGPLNSLLFPSPVGNLNTLISLHM